VTVRQIINRGGSSLLNYYGGSLFKALQSIYSIENWNLSHFKMIHGSKVQQRIWKMLKQWIPDLEMNYKHPQLIHKMSGRNMELDFWSPSLNIAIEYQGEYHYLQLGSWSYSFVCQQERDEEKKQSCKSLGISLISIPYWWDSFEESLISMIHQVRPDVLTNIQSKPKWRCITN